MDIEQAIRRFIAEQILLSDGPFSYSDDTSFHAEDIIDSLGILHLVEFVEANYGVTVDPLETTLDNFDSVNKLASYVRRKQAAAAPV